MPRTVVVHNHLFKNAGSTVDWALAHHFGRNFQAHTDDEPMRAGGADYLRDFLRRHPDIAAIASHHMPFPLRDDSEFQWRQIVFIRHPVERAASVYQFERRQRDGTPGARMAATLGFPQYLQWRFSAGAGRTLSNYQVRVCAGYKGETVTDDHLTAAVDHLDDGVLLGVVDSFHTSMTLVEAALAQDFPGIDLAYRARNINPARDRSGDIGTQADRVLLEAGEAADALLAHNQLDLQLYQWATGQLGKRVAADEGFQARSEALATRCAALAPAGSRLDRLVPFRLRWRPLRRR